MSEWSDQHGRYRFSPEAWQLGEAYLDRVEVRSEFIRIDGVSHRHITDFIRQLSRSAVFGRHSDRVCKVTPDWLFSGTVQASGHDGALTLRVFLSINPTRLLQAHGVPTGLEARRRQLADPMTAFRKGLRAQDRLDAARGSSMDGGDNVLLMPGCAIEGWPKRFYEYLCAALDFIEGEIREALYSMRWDGDLSLRRATWHLHQLEAYWEFAVPDAITKMARIRHTALEVLRDGYLTEYPPRRGSTRNAPYVSGQLNHADIRAKLYAKLSGVLRFEISYNRSPSGAARARGPAAGDVANIRRLVTEVSAHAAQRGSRFWLAFWHLHAPHAAFRAEVFVRLTGHVFAAARGSAISSAELLALLINSRRLEPMRGEPSTDPIRRLARAGVLTFDSQSPARPRYIVTAPYNALIAALRLLCDPASDLPGVAPDDDEEARPGRLRVRTRYADGEAIVRPRRARRRRVTDRALPF